MSPSVAAEHLDGFEARSAELMRNHMSASVHWKLLDDLYASGCTLLRPIGEVLVVAAMLWFRTGTDWAMPWAAAVLLTVGARARLFASYRAAPDRSGCQTWAWRFIVGTWIESALWGGLSALIPLSPDPVVHLIVAAALSNRLCDAVSRDSGEPRAAIGQVLLLLVPLALACLAMMDPIYACFGVLTIVQIVASSLRIGHLHRQTTGLLSANAAVETTNARLAQMNRKLASLASTDSLTKLSNRGGFDAALRREWGRAIREHRPLTVMLVQVDQLGKLNEVRGASEGDECLRRVADALQLTLRRPTDFAARYGVEEFAIVLPDTDRVAAHYLGERICAAIQTLGMAHPETASGQVTVSVGHSTVIPVEILVPSHLVGQAGMALGRAKASGRGCSCAWDEALDASATKGLPHAAGERAAAFIPFGPPSLARRLAAAAGTLAAPFHPTIEGEAEFSDTEDSARQGA
jgi:diguanylate cyclase (GGDEF)-like protein